MLNQLFRLLQKFRNLGFAKKELKEPTLKEHIQIIDALSMRNTAQAKDLMRIHIENSKIRALSQLYKIIS